MSLSCLGNEKHLHVEGSTWGGATQTDSPLPKNGIVIHTLKLLILSLEKRNVNFSNQILAW